MYIKTKKKRRKEKKKMKRKQKKNISQKWKRPCVLLPSPFPIFFYPSCLFSLCHAHRIFLTSSLSCLLIAHGSTCCICGVALFPVCIGLSWVLFTHLQLLYSLVFLFHSIHWSLYLTSAPISCYYCAFFFLQGITSSSHSAWEIGLVPISSLVCGGIISFGLRRPPFP